jgi:hypothetical protein
MGVDGRRFALEASVPAPAAPVNQFDTLRKEVKVHDDQVEVADWYNRCGSAARQRWGDGRDIAPGSGSSRDDLLEAEWRVPVHRWRYTAARPVSRLVGLCASLWRRMLAHPAPIYSCFGRFLLRRLLAGWCSLSTM